MCYSIVRVASVMVLLVTLTPTAFLEDDTREDRKDKNNWFDLLFQRSLLNNSQLHFVKRSMLNEIATPVTVEKSKSFSRFSSTNPNFTNSNNNFQQSVLDQPIVRELQQAPIETDSFSAHHRLGILSKFESDSDDNNVFEHQINSQDKNYNDENYKGERDDVEMVSYEDSLMKGVSYAQHKVSDAEYVERNEVDEEKMKTAAPHALFHSDAEFLSRGVDLDEYNLNQYDEDFITSSCGLALRACGSVSLLVIILTRL